MAIAALGDCINVVSLSSLSLSLSSLSLDLDLNLNLCLGLDPCLGLGLYLYLCLYLSGFFCFFLRILRIILAFWILMRAKNIILAVESIELPLV